MSGEVDGSFLNLEGRLSPLQAKVTAPGQARPDWMLAAELAAAVGADLGFVTLDELRADLSDTVAAFADVAWDALTLAGDGPLLPLARSWEPEFGDPVVAPSPDGYGLRLVVDRKLWDLGTMVQHSASLRALADPVAVHLSAHDLDSLGVDEGAPVTVEWSGGRVSLPVALDGGLPRGAARIPFRLPGFDVGKLVDSSDLVSEIRVTAS
jgi:predicted molibdopterin-dependent oxidoreductase YjgC